MPEIMGPILVAVGLAAGFAKSGGFPRSFGQPELSGLSPVAIDDSDLRPRKLLPRLLVTVDLLEE